MDYAYFPGCKIPHFLPEYGHSVLNICNYLNINLSQEIQFNCCGWPIRHRSFEASIFSAAYNLALAAQQKLNILTPCKCCFGNLKHAQHKLSQDPKLKKIIADNLEQHGLSLNSQVEVRHLLTVLDKEVGVETLKKKTKQPLNNLQIACHYGCHALRPGNITGFDDPLAPTIFERIMQAIGAKTVDWELRLECCGHPLRGRDEVISLALMRKKLENARNSKADLVATACTYCQMQFEQERNKLAPSDKLHTAPKAVLFTRLIEQALKIYEPIC